LPLVALFPQASYPSGQADDRQRQAIRLKPDFAKAYRGRAIEYLHLRQYDLAWSDVRICRRLGIALDPAFLTALARASGRRE